MIDSPKIVIKQDKPTNMVIFDDREQRTKTIKKGTPIGLLLCLTYPTDITVVA